MSGLRAITDLGRSELAVLAREFLLGGQMIDRAGMPRVIGAFGREVMGEIAIDEWMGASPIYTRRMQQVLGFVGDDVETIFKGMQFDIGAPPEFMDFRYRVIDHDHGEFWLDHCGALMDVEPMGEDYVFTMCHTIEDPTFDATACATNARAQMRPVHRPPREPADRHPHCHWTVTIVEDAEPVPEPEAAVRMAQTRLAGLPLPSVDASSAGDAAGGWNDYRAPLDPDLRTEQFSKEALEAIIDEIGVQWHLLAISFLMAIERRSTVEQAVEIGVQQFTGVGGLVAERIVGALGLGDGLLDIAQVLELHPAFHPRSYVDWRVIPASPEGGSLRIELHDCAALDETAGFDSWITALADGRADAALDAIVQAVDPRARCESVTVPTSGSDGSVAAWQVVIDDEEHPVSADVELARFSSGARFAFAETAVSLG